MQASIKDNVVFCKICEIHNYKILDYKTVEIKGQKHTKFIARCICGTEFYFFSKIAIDSEKHYVIDEDEETIEDKESLEMKDITIQQAKKLIEILNNPIFCENCSMKKPCNEYEENSTTGEDICAMLGNLIKENKLEEDEVNE